MISNITTDFWQQETPVSAIGKAVGVIHWPNDEFELMAYPGTWYGASYVIAQFIIEVPNRFTLPKPSELDVSASQVVTIRGSFGAKYRYRLTPDAIMKIEGFNKNNKFFPDSWSLYDGEVLGNAPGDLPPFTPANLIIEFWTAPNNVSLMSYPALLSKITTSVRVIRQSITSAAEQELTTNQLNVRYDAGDFNPALNGSGEMILPLRYSLKSAGFIPIT